MDTGTHTEEVAGAETETGVIRDWGEANPCGTLAQSLVSKYCSPLKGTSQGKPRIGSNHLKRQDPSLWSICSLEPRETNPADTST